MAGQDSDSIIKEIREQYIADLEAVEKRTSDHLQHPGLNHRYGLEIEFLSSASRWTIANRVNSCMMKQNDKWWRKNFNALQPIRVEIGDRRPITDRDDFDEWSGFFLEASVDRHASGHQGEPNCRRKGNAGLRIEYDVSVLLYGRNGDPNNTTGITLWSKRAKDNFSETDFAEKPGEFNQRASGLLTAYEENGVDTNARNFTVKAESPEFTLVTGQPNSLNVWETNEFVTNVLTNVHVKYPLKKKTDGTVGEGLMPLGGLSVDNFCNHMTAHGIVLGTQQSGFHLHISEFPIMYNKERRKAVVTGFVKLFYLFEPILYAFQPLYRSQSQYCQPLQSMFTLQEILQDDELIWNVLVEDFKIGGVTRYAEVDRINDLRYVAINLQNCKEGGINTLEIRLGHSTFDSIYIQSYVNVILNLYSLNATLMAKAVSEEKDTFYYHNELLKGDFKDVPFVPSYCNQTSYEYNSGHFNTVTKKGRPVRGFFQTHLESLVDPDTVKTTITNTIGSLLVLFQGLTGTSTAISYLIKYINLYYGPGNRTFLKPFVWADELDAEEISAKAIETFGPIDDRNNFTPVTLDLYKIRTDQPDDPFANKCKSCSESGGVCKADYNNGAEPKWTYDMRKGERSYKDEATIYGQVCTGDDAPVRYKTQTELINRKITRGQYAGKKLRKRTRRQKRGGVIAGEGLQPLPLTIENVKKYSPPITGNIRRGGVEIDTIETDGKISLGYVNWLGGVDPDAGLTAIANALLDQKIIDKPTLMKLVRNGYIDYYIFTNTEKDHVDELVKELGAYNISPETIGKIQKVYNDMKPKIKSIQAPTA